ncbi:ribonuclease III [Pseudovirgaria hyperparasitica]|uniref:Large ribosomal subunit protein mL44 n=1 Tax=Pseudovirgaria hyperparasitica TaxID=470096 RepID=A0A6A6WDM2_9PEZI|nr:ribonuclease III [Pseudovirgaria hyperparasitica]KAF2760665.1 ribonuclease III [Pseudovirgaria hyperparasitica]
MITAPMIAVLAFQFAGLEYHPPEGDQTSIHKYPLSTQNLGENGYGATQGQEQVEQDLDRSQWVQETNEEYHERKAADRDRIAKEFADPDLLLGSPSPSVARQSAKLAALHARLSLPTRFPLETLARTLVHPTANPSSEYNNESLAVLGTDLLAYYAAEHLLCHYPRLPMSVLFAAQWGYVGPHTLSAMASEWGIEHAYPGDEVEPGHLMFMSADQSPDALRMQEQAENLVLKGTANVLKRGANWLSQRDQFGEMHPSKEILDQMAEATKQEGLRTATAIDANASFIRALFGAIYLHCGRIATQRFFTSHLLSRQLDIASIFEFKKPKYDLSRLCAREGFDPPVARLISETGRLSRHPVFVVGVFSGEDELGQAAGASLDEARTRAAVAALKSWYLYSPMEVTKPSSVEGAGNKSKWIPNMVDPGEVVT